MKIIVSLIVALLTGILFLSYHFWEINLFLRTLGYVAFALLSFSLMVSPISSLINNRSIIIYRKVFGVLAFFIALAHASKYYWDEYKYNGVLFTLKHFLEFDVLSGTISLILITILGVTSLRFFTQLLATHWKSLHSLVFPLFIIVAAHIAFASRWDIWYMIMIGAVILVRTLAYIRTDPKKQIPISSWDRWLCVPCGYIYDPTIGDIDSGIAPGTAFADIPETWVCPVCGVKKSDFILIKSDKIEETTINAKLISYVLLNPTTLEISVEIDEKLESLPWQYMRFLWRDNDWEFSRCYSIVEQVGHVFTFCIKLRWGRSGVILSRLKIWDLVHIAWIYGQFTLHNTLTPKVFIASGTGLSPIISMISSMDANSKKILYFSVSHQNELFYMDRLNTIANLTTHIHITQEIVPGYETGRISLDGLTLPLDTEFYICGAPWLVVTMSSQLAALGYTSIFTEKF